MSNSRLEAFSDGVIAIIITIMVLELKVPQGDDLAALQPRIPVLLSYVLSFVYVGIYWNNHHHLMHAVQQINGAVLWANLHLLFWLSLIPVLTEWIGENYEKTAPAATYGLVCLAAAMAFAILVQAIIRADGSASTVASAMGHSIKPRVSPVLYAGGAVLAFVSPWISYALFATVALMWFIPDRRLTLG